MYYATPDDLKRRLGQAYERLYQLPDEPGVDLVKVEADLEAAAAEIDGKLQRRYRVPVTAGRALALLKSWNLTLAEELAWGQAIGTEEGARLVRRIEEVRRQLDLVMEGRFPLAGAAEAEHAGSVALVDGDPPEMTRHKLAGY